MRHRVLPSLYHSVRWVSSFGLPRNSVLGSLRSASNHSGYVTSECGGDCCGCESRFKMGTADEVTEYVRLESASLSCTLEVEDDEVALVEGGMMMGGI